MRRILAGSLCSFLAATSIAAQDPAKDTTADAPRIEALVSPVTLALTTVQPGAFAATRVRAPARTFTAVRAIAPVAGIPPNNGAAMLASPCPTSSPTGVARPQSSRTSATRCWRAFRR